MIYSRYGEELVIETNLGQQQPKGFKSPATLIVTRYASDGHQHFHFAETLKADGGWDEIKEAIDKALSDMMTGSRLKDAIKQAI